MSGCARGQYDPTNPYHIFGNDAGEIGKVKPDVIQLGPVTADLIERVKKLEAERKLPPLEHPAPVKPMTLDDIVGYLEEYRKKEAKPVQESWGGTSLADVRGRGPLKKILLVKIDVGQLPPMKAEAFVERMKDKWRACFERLPEDVGVIYLPVRPPNRTGVEIIDVA